MVQHNGSIRHNEGSVKLIYSANVMQVFSSVMDYYATIPITGSM